MAVEIKNTRIQLKRDNDFNYAAHPNFTPLKGEICLVDTASNGLKVKIGDGATKFSDLDWYYPSEELSSTKLNLGYLFNNNFYRDSAHTQLIEPDSDDLYIDRVSNSIYFYDINSQLYISVSSQVEQASEFTPGIMKLYKGIGTNEDGSMTQKSITEQINNLKFSVSGETLTALY